MYIGNKCSFNANITEHLLALKGEWVDEIDRQMLTNGEQINLFMDR